MKHKDFIFCLIAASCVAISYFATDIYLPAMPVLRTFFATDIVAIQTTMSIYMIGIVCAQLLFGPIADHFGFKQTALPLAILLILASLLCAFAQNLIILNIGRLLQALAAGGLAVIGRASFSRYFTPQRALGIYVAVIPPIAVLSPAAAPAIGGLLTSHFGWQSVFIFLCLLACLILFGLLSQYRIGKQADIKTSLNPIFIFKTYAKLFTHLRLLAYLSIIISTFAIYYAYMAESPFIFHSMGYSVNRIGFSFISIAIAFFAATQLSRILLNYISFKTILHLGLTLMVLGIATLLLLTTYMRLNMIVILIPTTFFMGAIGFLNPIAMSQGISLFPQRAGYASSVIGASALFGAALGSQFADLLTHGSIQRFAFISLIVMLFVWLLFSILMQKSALPAADSDL